MQFSVNPDQKVFEKSPMKQHLSILGAVVGRLVGEGSAYLLSDGISSGKSLINPGGYALAGKQTYYPVTFLMGDYQHCWLTVKIRPVFMYWWGHIMLCMYVCTGAAAFSGAVTHTLSPALLALEMTGQCSHAVPALVATLVSNAVARAKHRPSFYDGISLIKQLPHLPSLIRACPRWVNHLLVCLQALPCYDLKLNCIYLEMTTFWGETSRQWWLDSKLFSSWTLSYRLANDQIKQFVIPAGVVLERTETLASLKHILDDSADNEFPVVDSHGESKEYCITSSMTQLNLFDFNGTLLLDRREWKAMKCVPIRAKGQMIVCWWVETIKTASSR